jgi:Secretory lipase
LPCPPRPGRTRPSRRRVVPALLIVLLALAGCSADTDRRIVEGAAEVSTDRAFYTLPDPVPPGAPGSIVRTEPLPSTMEGSVAWRVLHHTTDQNGADRVVSAVVVAPAGPAPSGGRPVVAWGHPTTGAVARCAPSNGLDPFDLIEGLGRLLHAGYVVAAADYPGLGVEGQSSYLIGAAEAHSVIDAVRAARQLPEAGAGTDVLLWGHSQGGHAALFAGQAIGRYAPELRLRGVAVAAPATELATLLDDHHGHLLDRRLRRRLESSRVQRDQGSSERSRAEHGTGPGPRRRARERDRAGVHRDQTDAGTAGRSCFPVCPARSTGARPCGRPGRRRPRRLVPGEPGCCLHHRCRAPGGRRHDGVRGDAQTDRRLSRWPPSSTLTCFCEGHFGTDGCVSIPLRSWAADVIEGR